MGLQETRVADSNDIDFKGMWGNSYFEVAFVNQVRRSSDIISI